MTSILLVDDEPALLEIAEDFLTEIADFHVDGVISAEKALETMQHVSYDVIVSDYQMPGMDGIAFLKTVRNQNNDTPFILFTGRGREEVVIEAINSGADYYLQKGGDIRAQFSELAHYITNAHRGSLAIDTLRKRNEEMENFFDLSLDLECIANTDGFFLDLNPQWENVFGYPLEELKEVPYVSFIHPDDVEPTRRIMEEQILQKPVVNFINRFRCKDGSYRYLEWRSRPTGNLIYASARDITERYYEETRNRHLNGVLKAIRNVNQLLVKEKVPDRLLGGMCENLISTRGFESAWIVTYDRKGAFDSIHWAGNGLNLSTMRQDLSKGLSPPCVMRAIQRNSFVVSDRKLRDCFECKYVDGEKEGTAITMPLRYGQRLFGVITVSLPDGMVVASEELSLFEEIVGDISFGLNSIEKEIDHREAQKGLLESEKLFYTIFHMNPLANSITRMSDGRFIDVNDSYLKLMELTRKMAIGKTVVELQSYENIADRRSMIEELERNQCVRERKVSIRTGDGKIKQVIITMDPVVFKKEKCIFSTVRPI